MHSEKLICEEKINNALNDALNILSRSMIRFWDVFPSGNTADNGRYMAGSGVNWTSGMWTGMLWLAYEMTGDMRYRYIAEKKLEVFAESLKYNENGIYSNMGFVYLPSCAQAYKLTENTKARNIVLSAADLFMNKYKTDTGMCSWEEREGGELNALKASDMINCLLLNKSFEETGEGKYREVSELISERIIEKNVSEDGFVFFRYFFNSKSGMPLYGKNIGYRMDVVNIGEMSRTYAWMMYGLAMHYNKTGNEKFLKCFMRVAEHFFEGLPEDLIPYIYLADSEKRRDSSAAAITVCAIFEMAKNTDDEKIAFMYKKAEQMLLTLIDSYSNSPNNGDGLLKHAMFSVEGGADDGSTVFGDYFYLEALVRSIKDWVTFW